MLGYVQKAQAELGAEGGIECLGYTDDDRRSRSPRHASYCHGCLIRSLGVIQDLVFLGHTVSSCWEDLIERSGRAGAHWWVESASTHTPLLDYSAW